MTEKQAPTPMHIMITVSDYDRAIAFYTGALGFRIGFERTAEEAFEAVLQLHDVKFREAFLVLGGMTLALLHFERPQCLPAPEPASNRLGINKISFGVSDIDAAAALIVQHGGSVLEHTRFTTPSGTLITVTDPDETRLQLVQRTA
jgi:predicted enzyme related to lactoylglutathione lyase